jgi:FtsP/CotA-like multicopper oxidase with cupredoxin domain
MQFAEFPLRSLIAAVTLLACSSVSAAEPSRVLPNDNRRAAGTPTENALTLNLRAAWGAWQPEGEDGPSLRIQALGVEGDALSAPAPLIRVRAGTDIAVSIRNELETTLTVHGLCARNGERCVPLDVPPTETRAVHFTIDRPGTFHYWATTTGMPLAFRGSSDTQMSGALIVDPADGTVDADRVFVITEWTSLTPEELRIVAAADDPGVVFDKIAPRIGFFINGLSWPATERLTYEVGERVRWRIVNLSTQRHPMHLHGFYYQIDSLGDGMRDTLYEEGEKQRVVTQLMGSGSTMTLTWIPERSGNWLFHCHVMHHVSPERRLNLSTDAHAGHHGAGDPSVGMAGMVMGVTALGPNESTEGRSDVPAPRRLTLTMLEQPGRFGSEPAYAFALSEADAAGNVVPSVPGPTLVLERGRPVEITLVNKLREGTAIHWHGMELDSYYDGVHGWSGLGTRVTPLITPGGTFVVRFTPPRTGTFIYHTHLHDDRQLSSGLYGALLVVDANSSSTAYDPDTDHVFVIGRSSPEPRSPAMLNGSRHPQFVWKAGTRHRIRLINITTDDIFSVSLQTVDGPVTWRPLTKDGAPLPPNRCAPTQARQTIAVGETYDFEVEVPPGRRNLWLEVRSSGGKWHAQGQVIVK